MVKIGIYKITSPSDKIYIGQSINIDSRFNCYKNLNCKDQPKIYNSLKKYGPENHIFEIIEECPISYLNELEFWWKIYYNSVEDGLNCELYDNGVGPRSEEVKKKIGKAHKGNKYNLGKLRSEKTKQLQSKIAKSQEWRKTIGYKTKGKPKHTSEYKQKMFKKIKNNNTGKIYNSCTEACKDLGIPPALISHSLKKKYKNSKWDFIYI